MTRANKISVNFAGGEVTPDMQMRIDLPIHAKVLGRCKNLIVHPVGKAVFRTGTRYVHHTRGHAAAVFIPFQFSDEQSYLIEATDQKFRFYKDEGIITESTKTITAITKANPGVVTSVAHGYSNGDEVYLDSIVGMTELNGRFAIVANKTADTFELKDVFGNNINTTSYTTYTSGGTAARIYEIATPYLTADLEELQYAQTADIMYITHRDYEPRQLSRGGHTSWSLATYTRTADPFPASASMSAATASSSCLVTTTAAHNMTTGMSVTITGVVGMTELNDNTYTIERYSATRFYLLQNGVYVDSTAYSAYISGGTVTVNNIFPAAVSFTEDARTVMGGSAGSPEKLYYSRSPSAAGAVRFDDYTTGTDDDHAMIFTLAPLKGKVDAIRWITNTDKYLAVGTYGSVRRVYGATEAEPATPTGITAKPVNAEGVARTRPSIEGSSVFYVQRNALSLNSIEYDYQIDGYAPDDKNLVSDHLTAGIGLSMIARQVGQPTVIWAVRNDGRLLGLTYKAKENIAGWHQHELADGVVEAIGVMPRDDGADQLWLIVQRTVDGNTVRHVEFFTDPPVYPIREDFFGIGELQDEDDAAYYAYQWEKVKQAIHLDASLTYDGSAYGTDASATLTPASGAATVDTTGVTFTAGAAVFTSDMVGRELWGKYDDEGGGGGRAVITGYTDSTHVTCTITEAWPIETYAAGDWYLTTTSVTGLRHLEGETVGIVADGTELEDDTVSDGELTLEDAASVVHVGLKYEGMLKTLSLDAGGVSGTGINDNKNVSEVAIRFRNTDVTGVSFGTDLYRMESLRQDSVPLIPDRSLPLLNGLVRQTYGDGWTEDKYLYVRQSSPLPMTVLGLDLFADTVDE